MINVICIYKYDKMKPIILYKINNQHSHTHTRFLFSQRLIITRAIINNEKSAKYSEESTKVHWDRVPRGRMGHFGLNGIILWMMRRCQFWKIWQEKQDTHTSCRGNEPGQTEEFKGQDNWKKVNNGKSNSRQGRQGPDLKGPQSLWLKKIKSEYHSENIFNQQHNLV